MKTLMIKGCLFLLLPLLSPSLPAEEATGGAAGATPSSCRAAYMDCQRQIRAFSADLQALHEKGRTAPMKRLIRQLGRSRCDIRLSGPSSVTVNPSTLFEMNKKAVMILGSLYECPKCGKWHVSLASGFLVTPSGVMVTNYHVVDKPDRGTIGAMTYGGEVYPVQEVLAADRSSDVAVLRIEGRGFPYLGLSTGATVGEKVWVISHPRLQLFMFTEGIISGFFAKKWKGEETARMTITADFGAGSSGAPVFERSGRVVGMVASTLPIQVESKCGRDYAQMIVGHCIPSEYILELFSRENGGEAAGIKLKGNAEKGAQ